MTLNGRVSAQPSTVMPVLRRRSDAAAFCRRRPPCGAAGRLGLRSGPTPPERIPSLCWSAGAELPRLSRSPDLTTGRLIEDLSAAVRIGRQDVVNEARRRGADRATRSRSPNTSPMTPRAAFRGVNSRALAAAGDAGQPAQRREVVEHPERPALVATTRSPRWIFEIGDRRGRAD